ncbi:uncharacterized protein LOC107262917 [Cephus cinctus]|uniref:Uncharacterized protein LOC107262917 n=1 Tax=Cephus cinctus TaxID=211228 RepID=A0AAJ7BFW3_CEPCN|nr:uncharacterized protein LOC107262917 [Cephus cinctus]XP_015585076.1 uncharacterized protein LOC107262917 [Cephus cinctus]XP_015585086.1 uncharacterized protein LOC107262917 [Cephus cinctus]XP_015585104.1 uncharacterized protein LOC107262917 [Cephus cinctus]XP_015585113.1 uncharacterized protein LOC107262917 [Cephus cinctus]XP_015585121.1 uncharacterized protein LOC107262917 [Cephus cinctus]XP_015585134.1 uncharacterized protein LOC107262917 [Cephus cinctus]XP_024937687.1 uncharacterized p
MALLYRFTQLPDRGGTRVFSFVVTRSVVRDPERDVTSKELVCGFQRWAVAFSRGDKVLGVYLVWRGAAPGLRVYVDFTFTLLNREHFSVNEGFSGKRVKFTYDAPAQGNRNYIPVSDLYSRNFADPNGEFQLELSMANVRTVYTDEVRMPTGVFTAGQSKPNKLETGYFTFGGFDWNLTIYPFGNKEGEARQEGRLSVYLVRLTGFDHRCRVRYSIALGEGDRRIESGHIEDLSDAEGRGFGWHPRLRWSEIAHKGVVRVSLEMVEARTISEVAVQALGPSVLPAAPCYDRDKQAWAIRADLHSDTIRLHLVYKDIHNVPRNHLRYVSWSAYLMRGEEPDMEAAGLPGAPFSRYYAQEPADEGIIMETSLGVTEVKDDQCPFLTDKGQLRVRLEWNESHLLFQATYHKYDDVCRVHNQQMRREIAALQAENYSLERQLFSYQKSLAYAQAQQQSQQQGPGGHLERSASTDTEYA